MTINSRTRTTLWIGLEDDPKFEKYEISSEDDMLSIETTTGDNEVDILISPKLFDRIKEVIEYLQCELWKVCQRLLAPRFEPVYTLITWGLDTSAFRAWASTQPVKRSL